MLIVLVLFASLSLPQVGLSQVRIWRWEPPYDPAPTLIPVLKEKGVSVQEWRFCEAIKFQTLELVLQMLEKGSDPTMTCERHSLDEVPAIFLALIDPDSKPELVRALVKRGADANLRYTHTTKQRDDQSATERVVALIVRISQDTDYFPLYFAARNTNAAVVQTLLEMGADANAQTGVYRVTALIAAREPDIGRVLVRFGANVNLRDAKGRTALTAAQDSLGQLMEGHYLRAKYEAYVAWLRSVGAHE